jgi:hypothetical protein
MEKVTRKDIADYYGVKLRTFYRHGGLKTYPVPEQLKEFYVISSPQEFAQKVVEDPKFLRAYCYKKARQLIEAAQRELCG